MALSKLSGNKVYFVLINLYEKADWGISVSLTIR
jgi:hypothetical protein